MNLEQSINQFLKRFRSVPNESEQLENTYIPNEPKKSVRTERTVYPTDDFLINRPTFNNTFGSIHNESNKLKFNR